MLGSRLDPSSAEFAADREAMLAALAGVDEVAATVLAAGGAKYVDRHHERGRLTARERVDLLLDPDAAFLEIGALAGAHEPDLTTPGAGLVVGIGAVSGVECLIVANEPTVKGGSITPIGVTKQLRGLEIAERNRLPVVALVESGGADLPRQADLFVPGGRTFREMTRLSAQGIPTIALVFGSSTAGGAYMPGMSEYTVFVRGPGDGLPGRAAAGEDGDQRGRRRRDPRRRGDARPRVRARRPPGRRRARRAADRAPDRRRPGLASRRPRAVAARRPAAVPGRGAARVRGVGREALASRCATSSPASSTARASTSTSRSTARRSSAAGARSAASRSGCSANNGILFSEESQKGAQFVQLANARSIPLLFVQNITGFMVGSAYERGGIIKDGAKLINAVSNSEVPHLTLMVGASYGAGNYGMSGRAYDPRFVFTWPNHRIAVMGGTQLAGVMSMVQRRSAERAGRPYDEDTDRATRKAIEDGVEAQSNAVYASGRMWDDGVIDPRDTRTVLGLALSAVHSAPIAGATRFAPFRM